MVKESVRKIIKNRDSHCFHCGATENLVIHHRKNRQMGGSKVLDKPENLIMVCAEYNNLMESDSEVAKMARAWGHKLASWQKFELPCFDKYAMTWYVLDNCGGKKEWHHAGRETGLFVPGLPD